jgi:hypothetical protein
VKTLNIGRAAIVCALAGGPDMARAPFRLLFAALAVAAVFQGCDIKVDDKGDLSIGVSRGRASDQWVRSYTLAKGGRFEIVNQNGEIQVKGAPQGSAVKVTAHRQVFANSDEEAQRRLQNLEMREEVTADRVVVEARGQAEGFSFRQGVGVRWEVEVPAGLTATFKTMNGTIRLDGVDGRITAATTNGNVSGTGVSGSVQGSSVNGSVAVTFASIDDDVRLNTVNGSIRLLVPPTEDLDLDASTTNGGVSVDDRLGLADVSGNRSTFGPATSIRGRLNKGGPRATLQTTNGGVRVTVPGTSEDDDGREDRRERQNRRGRDGRDGRDDSF